MQSRPSRATSGVPLRVSVSVASSSGPMPGMSRISSGRVAVIEAALRRVSTGSTPPRTTWRPKRVADRRRARRIGGRVARREQGGAGGGMTGGGSGFRHDESIPPAAQASAGSAATTSTSISCTGPTRRAFRSRRPGARWRSSRSRARARDRAFELRARGHRTLPRAAAVDSVQTDIDDRLLEFAHRSPAAASSESRCGLRAIGRRDPDRQDPRGVARDVGVHDGSSRRSTSGCSRPVEPRTVSRSPTGCAQSRSGSASRSPSWRSRGCCISQVSAPSLPAAGKADTWGRTPRLRAWTSAASWTRSSS